MSTGDEDPGAEAEAEAEFRALIQPRFEDAAPLWTAALGADLEHERRRRGLTERPSHLRLRAGAVTAVGVLLLVLALTQV